jgi:hypothetical protein
MLSSVDGKIDALAEFLVLSGVVFKEVRLLVDC